MIAHRSPVSGVDAVGAKYVATVGYDNQVILWDTATKRGLARSFHDHLVNQCRFSSCGSYLVTASSDYSARVWDVPSMQLRALLRGHDDDVEMAVLSPDGSLIATASRDNTVGVFQIDGNLKSRLHGHRADVISVEWSRDGDELVSTSDDGTIRRWSAADGRLVETIDLHGVETDTAAVDDDGVIYAGNDDGDICMIVRNRLRTIPAHRAGIKRVLLDRVRRRMITSSYDRTIKVWDLRPDEAPIEAFQADVPDCVWLRSCAFAGEGQVVFGTFGSSYATFSLASRKWNLDRVEPTPGVNAVRMVNGAIYTVGDAGVVFEDGKPISRPGSLCNFIGFLGSTIVTGGQAGIVFNARTGEPVYQHRSPLNCSAAFTRNDRRYLVIGAYTGEGLVFEEIGESLRLVHTIHMHENAIKGIACNDTSIFSVCADGSAAFHSIETLNVTRSIPNAHRKISNGAAALPDGRFASVSRDLSLRIWTHEMVEEFASPHGHSIKCIAVCSQTGVIATGSYSGCVELFDPRKSRWVSIARPTAAGISCICPTQEPVSFVASSYDGHTYSIGLD